MRKRLIAAFMAAVVVISMCFPFSFAVTPADPLIASAVYSFILSAGIKLFRDGGIEGTEDLVTDMQALYATYKNSLGTYSDWDTMGQGIVYNSGNFIYTRDTALTLQSFTDWLGDRIGNTPNAQNTVLERIPQLPDQDVTVNETSGLDQLNNGVWDLPLNTYKLSEFDIYITEQSLDDSEPAQRISINGDNSDLTFFITESETGDLYFYFVSTEQFTGERTTYRYRTDEEGHRVQEIVSVTDLTASVRSISNTYITNNNGRFRFYILGGSGVLYTMFPVENYFSDHNSYQAVVNEMAYVALAGDKEEVVPGPSGSIIGKLSNAILDVAHNIADQGALAIDIGVSASTTQDEAIDTVVSDFADPVSVAIPEAVATPIPAEGVSELYPQPATTDVESLGLPELGQALTSRFPFCIPFDVVSVYKSLNATAVCPVINVDLFPASFKSKVGVTGDTSFTIDFGDQKYTLFIQLIHWGSLVGFIIMLAFATKRLIWTTGG